MSTSNTDSEEPALLAVSRGDSIVTDRYLDNRGASIGMQVNSESIYFGGEVPSALEHKAIQRYVEERFASILAARVVNLHDVLAIDKALRRLFSGRVAWRKQHSLGFASFHASHEHLADFYLPLEFASPPTNASGIIIRCEYSDVSAKTTTEEPCPRPEGGRIVLVTSDVCSSLIDSVLIAVQERSCAGFHTFDASDDFLRNASPTNLDEHLGPTPKRPGAAVLHIVTEVREGGLVFRGDKDEPSIIDAESLAAMLVPFATHLRLVVITPVCADEGLGGHDPGRAIVECALALHRRGLEAVVAPRIPLGIDTIKIATDALYSALLGSASTPPESLEGALARVNHRLRLCPGLDRMGLRLYSRAENGDDTRPIIVRPYRGLLSFEREHARFYLGREEEIAEIEQRLASLAALNAPRFLFLVGASGAGKSSLAKAGVVPALLDQDSARTVVISRPSGEPTLDGIVPSDCTGPLLLVVDQVESVIFGGSKPESISDYFQRLWRLSLENENIVIAVLRIDALNEGGTIVVAPATETSGARTLEDLIFRSQHSISVAHLRAPQLERVIREPAQRVGLAFEEGLVERLCEETLAEPGALPMLELVLDKLWLRRNGARLSANKYEYGLAGTLESHANSCVDSLPDVEKSQAKRILTRIATGQDIEFALGRRRSTIGELCPRDPHQRLAFERALGALVEGRLLVIGSYAENAAGSSPSVELAHELLLRRWSRLKNWLLDDQPRLQALRELTEWVREWTVRGTLLTGQQVKYVQSHLVPEDLSGVMTSLVDQSKRDLQRKRWARRLTIVVGLVLAGLTALLVAWLRASSAKESEARKVADEQKLQVQNLREKGKESEIIEQALKGIVAANDEASSLQRTLLVGVEALRLVPTDHPAATFATQALLDALRETAYSRLIISGRGSVEAMAISSDGSLIAAALADHTITVTSVFDAPSGVESTLRGHTDEITAIQFYGEPGAEALMSASKDGYVRFWRIRGAGDNELFVDGEIKTAAVTSKGDLLALVVGDTITIRRVADGQLEFSYQKYPSLLEDTCVRFSAAGDVAFAADGRNYIHWSRGDKKATVQPFPESLHNCLAINHDGTLVVRTFGSDASLVDVRRMETLRTFRGHTGLIGTAHIEDSGNWVQTGSADGDVRVWRTDDNREPYVYRVHELGVSGVASAMNRGNRSFVVASSSYDGTVRIWDLPAAKGHGLRTLVAMNDGDLSSAVFDPESRRVLTASGDGKARIWDLDSHREVNSFGGDAGPLERASYDKTGAHILTLSTSGTVQIWDGMGMERLASFSVSQERDKWGRAINRIAAAEFEPDGERVITASEDGKLRLWSFRGIEERALVYHEEQGYEVSMEVGRSGRKVLAYVDGGDLRVWDIDSPSTPMLDNGIPVRIATFGHDDNFVFAWRIASPAGSEGLVRWPVGSPGDDIEIVGVRENEHTSLRKLLVRPDNRMLFFFDIGSPLLVTGVGFWDSGLQMLDGGGGDVRQASMSPSGERIVALTRDGALRIWPTGDNLQHDKSFLTLQRPMFLSDLRGNPVDATFSSDDRMILAKFSDNVIVWDISPDALIEAACDQVGRNLSSAEWEQIFPRDLPYHPTCSQWPSGAAP